MKSVLLVPVLLIALFPVVARGGEAFGDLSTDRQRYQRHHDVTITLTNTGSVDLDFTSPWRVEKSSGKTLASFHWNEQESSLAPGESLSWSYPQDFNACSSDGTCTKVGGHIRYGVYVAEVDTDVGTLRTEFTIGRYFTLGFRCGEADCAAPDRFVVFAARHKAVEQMTKEAKAKRKTMIVSGIVRGASAYNPAWSFRMGPRSIVLGEVFIEVCDASPNYVENHRDDWLGERWCPWSSYVKKGGR